MQTQEQYAPSMTFSCPFQKNVDRVLNVTFTHVKSKFDRFFHN